MHVQCNPIAPQERNPPPRPGIQQCPRHCWHRNTSTWLSCLRSSALTRELRQEMPLSGRP